MDIKNGGPTVFGNNMCVCNITFKTYPSPIETKWSRTKRLQALRVSNDCVVCCVGFCIAHHITRIKLLNWPLFVSMCGVVKCWKSVKILKIFQCVPDFTVILSSRKVPEVKVEEFFVNLYMYVLL